MRCLWLGLLFAQVSMAAPATFDKTSGTVEWKGEMIGGETHVGTIEVKSGKLDLASKKGEFVIDMSTIKPTGMPQDKARRLQQHLEGPDFFDAWKFPESKLVVKDLVRGSAKDSYEVLGDLTIRGVTEGIKFPAVIMDDGKSLEGTLVFDRSKFKQSYQIEGLVQQAVANVKQSVIKNNVELKIKLKGK